MISDAECSVRFTDEELVLIGADHPVVDLPFLRQLEPAQQRLATHVAYRSLCSHGAIALNGGTGIELPEWLVTVLQIRAADEDKLVVNRTTPTLGMLRYHHLGREAMVIEDVSDDGVHELRLVAGDSLREELRRFCAVGAVADGSGPSIELSEEAFCAAEGAAELWGEGVAQFDATMWRPARGTAAPAAPRACETSDAPAALPVTGFLLGTRGSYLCRRSGDSGGAGAAKVTLVPILASEVSDLLLAYLVTRDGDAGQDPPSRLMRA